jgi:predicted N-formylglutamate amidohydrolase
MLRFLPEGGDAPHPFHRTQGTDQADVLVVCDHASALIPPRYGDLGLDARQRQDHIAWDRGAADVAIGVAGRLGCPAILAGVSRLVIDCNRQPGDPASIPAATCGVDIPGNRMVDDAEAAGRAQAWFWPYHQAIGDELARLFRRGRVPAVVSIHSFTASLNGVGRPWHVGVLSNRDRRMAEPVLAALQAAGGLTVGDNQPYSGRQLNYSLDTHAGAAGLPHVSFEIRQDQLTDAEACDRWSELLAGVLRPVLADPALRRVRVY